jgi:hypothetical protein
VEIRKREWENGEMESERAGEGGNVDSTPQRTWQTERRTRALRGGGVVNVQMWQH